MKGLIVLTLAGAVLAGCATTEPGSVTRTPDGTRVYGLDDQPQTVVTGQGSLMPGAYGSRHMQTGQFTGRERTSDQVGQRPTLPREADPRELARDGETSIGAGTLGQSGIVPGQPVTGESLIVPITAPAHAVVVPPGSETPIEEDEAVGNAPEPETGTESSVEPPK